MNKKEAVHGEKKMREIEWTKSNVYQDTGAVSNIFVEWSDRLKACYNRLDRMRTFGATTTKNELDIIFREILICRQCLDHAEKVLVAVSIEKK